MLSFKTIDNLGISQGIKRPSKEAIEEINHYFEILYLYNGRRTLKTFMILYNMIGFVNHFKTKSAIEYTLDVVRGYVDNSISNTNINYLNFRDYIEKYFNDVTNGLVLKINSKVEYYEFYYFNILNKVERIKKYLVAFKKAKVEFNKIVLAMMIYHQIDQVWFNCQDIIENQRIKEELILDVNLKNKKEL